MDPRRDPQYIAAKDQYFKRQEDFMDRLLDDKLLESARTMQKIDWVEGMTRSIALATLTHETSFNEFDLCSLAAVALYRIAINDLGDVDDDDLPEG